MNKTELLNEAKKAKSIEELIQMAADAGIALTAEKAKFYFSLVNEDKSELSLNELDMVTGGSGAGSDDEDRSDAVSCSNWQCIYCKKSAKERCRCSYNGCSQCTHYTRGKAKSKCSLYSDNSPPDTCG